MALPPRTRFEAPRGDFLARIPRASLAVLGKAVCSWEIWLFRQNLFKHSTLLQGIWSMVKSCQISDWIKDTPRTCSISSMNFVKYQDLELEHLTALASLGALLSWPGTNKGHVEVEWNQQKGYHVCDETFFSPINMMFISFDVGLTRCGLKTTKQVQSKWALSEISLYTLVVPVGASFKKLSTLEYLLFEQSWAGGSSYAQLQFSCETSGNEGEYSLKTSGDVLPCLHKSQRQPFLCCIACHSL